MKLIIANSLLTAQVLYGLEVVSNFYTQPEGGVFIVGRHNKWRHGLKASDENHTPFMVWVFESITMKISLRGTTESG